jgi:hypothetical protein
MKQGRRLLKHSTMDINLTKLDKKRINVDVYLFSDILLVLSNEKNGKLKVEFNVEYKNMKVIDIEHGLVGGIGAYSSFN